MSTPIDNDDDDDDDTVTITYVPSTSLNRELMLYSDPDSLLPDDETQPQQSNQSTKPPTEQSQATQRTESADASRPQLSWVTHVDPLKEM